MHSLAEARAWVVKAFVASRTTQPTAEMIADALLRAEVDGKFGHGLERVLSYSAAVRAGSVDGLATPSATTPRPALLLIDAKGGFAYPALRLALEQLPKLAASHGIALAGIRNSHHSGVLGHHVEDGARAGFATMMLGNTPAAIAPWGGKGTPLLGTNPIAFGMPIAGSPPLVIDMAVSKVARGPIAKAANAGEDIPSDWALDKDGNPTTDPKAALAGSMVPLGGLDGGVKGYALALMGEALAGALVGAHFGYEASSFFVPDPKNPPLVGQVIMMIDSHGFAKTASARMAELARLIVADGGRLPGASIEGRRQHAQKHGIAIPAHVAECLNDLIANPL